MSGGIAFDALYGGQAPPAQELLHEGSAARRLRVELNTTPPAPFALDFAARSVLVDNASGAWYQVNGRWLPPWTIGAVVLLDVPDINLEVEAGPPGGHFSVLAGEPLLLVALAASLAPHPGLAIAPHRSELASLAWVGGGSPAAAQDLVAVQSGATRLMIDAITFAAAGSSITGTSNVRDTLTAILYATSAPATPAEDLATMAISPATPSARIAFEPGAIITEPLRGLGVAAWGNVGAGASAVNVIVEYRPVVTA